MADFEEELELLTEKILEIIVTSSLNQINEEIKNLLKDRICSPEERKFLDEIKKIGEYDLGDQAIYLRSSDIYQSDFETDLGKVMEKK